MRDPARIDRILELLRQHWERYPDLRLAQIVVGMANPRDPAPQVFYFEDDPLEAALQQKVNALPPDDPIIV